jgi:hypothetical protein
MRENPNRFDEINGNEGWLKIFGEEEYHYFATDGKTLCGKLMLLNVPSNADQEHCGKGNCVICYSLILAQLQKGRL